MSVPKRCIRIRRGFDFSHHTGSNRFVNDTRKRPRTGSTIDVSQNENLRAQPAWDVRFLFCRTRRNTIWHIIFARTCSRRFFRFHSVRVERSGIDANKRVECLTAINYRKTGRNRPVQSVGVGRLKVKNKIKYRFTFREFDLPGPFVSRTLGQVFRTDCSGMANVFYVSRRFRTLIKRVFQTAFRNGEFRSNQIRSYEIRTIFRFCFRHDFSDDPACFTVD